MVELQFSNGATAAEVDFQVILGRQVTEEGVGISLWGGIGIQLTGVVVGNPVGFSEDPLFRAENVDLKLQLRPLLSRWIHADRMVVNHPRILLVNQKDGGNIDAGQSRGRVGFKN